MREGTESPFGNPTIHITTHDESTSQAVVHSSTQNTWSSPRGMGVEFNVVYTTSSFPASLNEETDITVHKRLMSEGKLGLVNPGGTVFRIVDFGPGHQSLMHRTQSLDYGVVLEGEIYMDLDSGETKHLKKGDVAIQRGTNHAWRVVDETKWTRMLFVLQDCQPLKVRGKRLKEDLGEAKDLLPRSGNDE